MDGRENPEKKSFLLYFQKEFLKVFALEMQKVGWFFF